MAFIIDLKCPHCALTKKKDMEYQDLHTPFVVKCDRARAGCGKYFAVKITVNITAESAKIFEGAEGSD